MKNIPQIILLICANMIDIVCYREERFDNYEESPYYKGLTKDEKKMLSDYLVNKYAKDWDNIEKEEKSMYDHENIFRYLVEELKEMSLTLQPKFLK